MHRKQMFRIILVILAIMALTLILGSSAWAAEQYKTIHRFNKQTGVRGFAPAGALILDAAGNLYGTTYSGGASGVGTVFELTPNLDGSWTESVLHSFNGADGADPYSGLIFDAAGNLYGTTVGGGGYNAGTVFKLAPNLDGSWTESVLHSFNGTDGAHPYSGLIFDTAGSLYGTTWTGGTFGHGTAFELTPNGDGSWTESVLHAFSIGSGDGYGPRAGLIFDAAGNLYGTTENGGGALAGTVFKLTPNGDGTWTESVLYSLRTNDSDGTYPVAGLIFDAAGNLYGTTENGGGYLKGTVFKLAPNLNGSWTESLIHSFFGPAGRWPFAGLIFDAAGNLYGTTERGGGSSACGYGCGTVFKLMPTPNGAWRFRVLHKFTGTPGAYPFAGVIFDPAGNLYGTTRGNGKTTFGSVYQITP